MKGEGLSEEEARSRFWVVDKDGLLHSGRKDLTAEQSVYAQPESRVSEWPRTSNGHIGLADVIGKIDATVLIGLSTVGGAFSEPIVREMARKVERPIIFPLSNPTSKSEANAEDLIRWTDGRALVASGSPFAPVSYGGRKIQIAQCNNVYIFPAMGLGVVASGARRVTESMMLAAARDARRKFAGPQRSFRVFASSSHRTQKSGCGNRGRGRNGSTKRWRRPRRSVRTNCVSEC